MIIHKFNTKILVINYTIININYIFRQANKEGKYCLQRDNQKILDKK
jgi:hypothetical protein